MRLYYFIIAGYCRHGSYCSQGNTDTALYWLQNITIGTVLDISDPDLKLNRWYLSKVIEMKNIMDIALIKITFVGWSNEFDEWLNIISDLSRMAKNSNDIRLHYLFRNDTNTWSWTSESRLCRGGRPNNIYGDKMLCLGSGGSGSQFGSGSSGGGILTLLANNIVIKKGAGIYSNGADNISDAGYGSGGSIYIECSKLENQGIITSLSNKFISLQTIKCFVIKYCSPFPNELINMITNYVDDSAFGCGKIIIRCDNIIANQCKPQYNTFL